MQTTPGGNELLNASELLKRIGVGTNMHVGDLGCGGVGYFTLQSARLIGDHGVVYAVDILKSALTNVGNLAKQDGFDCVKLVWSDLERYGATKIPAASLDIALVVNILFQSSKRDAILREAVRLMKPGGKLLVVDWKTVGSPLGPPPANRVAPESIRTIARSLGLEEIDSFEAGQFHYGLLFAKPAAKR